MVFRHISADFETRYPLDVVKTRVYDFSPSNDPLTEILNHHSQLQTSKSVGAESYNGMVDCFQKIVKHEGFEDSWPPEGRSRANDQV